MDGSIDNYTKKLIGVFNKILIFEKEKIKKIAKNLSSKYLNGNHLFVFGTGHNHCIAEESLHRAGAFAAVTPILNKKIDFSEGIVKASINERDKTLAKSILNNYNLEANDSIIIFSNSGVNKLPIEIAKLSKKRGLYVITVMSLKYAKSLTLKSGRRLNYYSDIFINNYSPIGDTLLKKNNIGITSSSTMAGIFILNSLWAEMHKFLKNEKFIPFYKSSNLPGSTSHNKKLENKFKKRNIFLK